MRAVVQRVGYAELKVDSKLISKINAGFLVFFGVAVGDTSEQADYLAKKISALRIFEDTNSKMNLSISDIGGEILVVSQFTLLANVTHGNRPDFINAEKPQRANELYVYFMNKLSSLGCSVKSGVFGADMKIIQQNDGPVTIIYEI